jgi:hypothetical protein
VTQEQYLEGLKELYENLDLPSAFSSQEVIWEYFAEKERLKAKFVSEGGNAADLSEPIPQAHYHPTCYLGAPAASRPPVEPKPADNVHHSDDFRSVVWFGTSYTFTKSQAACVEILWAAREAGTPELDGLTVVTKAEVAQTRLIDVFRSNGKTHPAWGTMIVPGTSKGARRLNENVAGPTQKPTRKQSRKTTRKTHQ